MLEHAGLHTALQSLCLSPPLPPFLLPCVQKGCSGSMENKHPSVSLLLVSDERTKKDYGACSAQVFPRNRPVLPPSQVTVRLTSSLVSVESTAFSVWSPSVLFSLFFVFLGPHLRYMEVPSLGVELELQLPAYTTATAARDLNRVFNLHHSSRQRRILNALSKARD